jgi:hypothetical protein
VGFGRHFHTRDYILYMDSDDYYSRDYPRIMVRCKHLIILISNTLLIITGLAVHVVLRYVVCEVNYDFRLCTVCSSVIT